ncbi:MAG: FAD-dependent oxidoreductase, partial [Chloroflexota bacterium]
MSEQQAGERAAFPDQARVVVVGGGAIGASIAYHLGKLGWTDTVLLERRQLTAGTTWHAAGLITSAGMAGETLLWMARYTRDLCTTLEAETGQSTGFRPIGHIHLACTPQRLETLRREASFVRGFGVPNEEISAAEFKRHWPEAKTDDVLAAFYVADEGRANPADLTQAYARGARMAGVRIFEGTTVTGFTSANGAVTGVDTDRGHIRAEYVVLAGGMWGRELGAKAGVSIPLQAAEHYYLITDTVPWAHADLPIVEDPDRYGYYREEGGGILVGLFEPKAAAWSLDKVPADVAFASLPPDWDRIGGYLDDAMDRFPSLREAGIRTMFCGPESFTPDLSPQLGESPELRNFFVASGLNSLGILLSGGVGSMTAQWIADGVPPVDTAGLTVDRNQTFLTSRAYRAARAPELLGALFGDSSFPTWQQKTGRNVRRSVIHDRLADAGAHFSVSSGWEYPEWFAEAGTHPLIEHGWGRDASFPLQAAEHRAVREAVGMLDMSLMAKFLVQGRDAERVLSLVSANDVAVPVGRIVYTQWLNTAGGIEADLTVTRLGEERFLVVVTDSAHRRIA